jgi:hypothetical protein
MALRDEPCALQGVRRQVKELVDGTLSLTVHIAPYHRAAFWRLFPEIDTPVALAPLQPEASMAASTTPLVTSSSNDLEPVGAGPLCRLAAMWCKDEAFQKWVLGDGQYAVADDAERERICAGSVRKACLIDSRRELDTNPEAKARFDKLIRHPFVAHLKTLQV